MTTSVAPRKGEKSEVAERPAGYTAFPALVERMRGEMQRLLDSFGMNLAAGPTASQEGFTCPFEITEEDKAVVIRAETPGFSASDIDLRVCDGRVTLLACKTDTPKTTNGQISRARRLQQTIVLPAGVDCEKVEAQYQDGLLTIRMGKTQEGKARKIPIRTG